MHLRRFPLLYVLLVASLIFAGCTSGAEATDTPTPVPTFTAAPEETAAKEAVSPTEGATATVETETTTPEPEATEASATETETTTEPASTEATAVETEPAATPAPTLAVEPTKVAVPQVGEEDIQALDTNVLLPGVRNAAGKTISATDLIGYSVRNPSGEDLGEVADLVVNLSSGQVVFATVEFGGFLGFEEEVVPIPLNAFVWDAETDVLLLDIPEETLQNAPSFADSWPDLTDSRWDVETENFWAELGIVTRAEPAGGVRSIAGTAIRASDLLGRNVDNPDGNDLGEIQNLLIDLETGQVRYAVMSFGGFLGIGEDLFLVPLNAFDLNLSAETGLAPNLSLDVTEEQLQSAPTYDPGTVDFTAPDWDADFLNFWRGLAPSAPMATPEVEATATVTATATATMTTVEESGIGGTIVGLFSPAGPAARIGQVMGADVQNLDGETIAQLTDVVVNAQDGTVPYVLLTTDQGNDLIPVPSAIVAQTPQGDALVLPADAATLADAPRFGPDETPDFTQDLFLGADQDIIGYWSNVGTPLQPILPSASAQATGPFLGTFRGLAPLGLQASQILDQPVINQETEEEIGTIEDLVFSDGLVRYAALSLNQADNGDSRTLVPLYVLFYNHETQTFSVAMETQRLTNAPAFAVDEWPDIAVPDWDQAFIDYWDTAGLTATPGIQMIASSLVPAERLLGFSVVDTNGEDLGEISDMVVDMENDHIRYAVIEFGGFLGFAEDAFAIPLDQLTISTINGQLVTDLDERALDTVPSFPADEWPDLTDPTWDAEIRDFWQTQSATTSEVGSATQVRLTNLLDDWTVMDAAGEEIGQVDDLIVDLFQAQIIYAVLQTDGYLDLEQDNVIVPFDRMSLADSGDAIDLDVDVSRLSEAPVFDAGLWSGGLVPPNWRQNVDSFWNTD